jgi:adenylosuccinate lyase
MAAGRRIREGETGDLLDRIAGDPAFRVGREELNEWVDPIRFVGRAPEQVDRFLAEWVAPALEGADLDADAALGGADVRV